MITSQEIELAVLITIAFIYALFDVFNKRNVPNMFVYATIAVGIVVALLFNSGLGLIVAFLIAIMVGLIGYALYKTGLLGGGDVLEFVFIALVLPTLVKPFYSSMYQWNIPFVLSVIIASGYASLIFMPIYYLGIKKPKNRVVSPSMKNFGIGVALFVAYMALIVAMVHTYGVSLLGVVLVLILAVSSAVTIVYQQRIYLGMVDFIYPSTLEDGDMIATNLMNKKELAFFMKESDFGRLATTKLISEIKGIKKRIPVYRDSVPFSLFIFIGIIISLLFGNLILIITGL